MFGWRKAEPRRRASALRVGAAALLWLAAGAAYSQVRPSCEKVIAEVDRNIAVRRGAPAGAVAVSKNLDTELEWVRRCMEVYGRIPARRSRLESEEREALQEAIETGQPLAEVIKRGVREERRAAKAAEGKPKLRLRKRPTPPDAVEKEFSVPFFGIK